jgi:hypothetical protein
MKRKKAGISPKTSPLRAKICGCLALAALALLVRQLAPKSFCEALLYRIDAGPDLYEIAETLGQTPVSAQALKTLWQESVVEALKPGP